MAPKARSYPPDRELDIACQNCGSGEFRLHVAQTQHRVPAIHKHQRLRTDRWTLLDFRCANCGVWFTLGIGLPVGSGLDKRLAAEGTLRSRK
jgi:DNA-directed RNA polymerase subunit RPC12/RpoP